MTQAPLRVLCLDIEGGHGGSSRSLHESLRHMDRSRVAPEVWCRRGGRIEALYAELGIPCRVEPALPKVSSLPRISRNLIAYAGALPGFVAGRPALQALAREVNDRFEVVHFNHEGFWLLARWLRPRAPARLVMHIRTNLWDTAFARRQIRSISRIVDRLVFITENERAHFRSLGGRGQGTVIYNIVAPPQEGLTQHADIPRDERFKLACLSTYTWNRGLDRLADVAAALEAAGRSDFLFVMAGDMRLSRSLPGRLGAIGRRGGSLADYVAERGLADSFLFLGHVAQPERVLAGCQALAKPTREDNPWGRDVLEALASGKPVLSVGSWEIFVEDGVTGFLKPSFDAGEWARALIRLADDPERRRAMAEAGKARVMSLCHGPSRAAELAQVWQSAGRASGQKTSGRVG